MLINKYMVMSRDQNAGRSLNTKTDNRSFKRVEQFKYLGKTLTNQNSIQEEIKSRVKSGKACYHLVQNLLPSSFLSKNIKIKTHGTTILAIALYGCETWSLTLREERRLSVSEKRVLRRMFGPKRDEVTQECRKLHSEELNDLYCIVRVIKSRKMRWAGSVAHMGERRGVYRVLVWKPEGKKLLGRPRRRWEDNIKMDLQKVGWRAWTGSIWLRIGTGGGHLITR